MGGGATMLYDTEGTGCGSFTERTSSPAYSGNGGDITALYCHLKSTSGVMTNSWAAPDWYYSYTNMFNPAPCAEAAAGWTVAYLKATMPTVDFSALQGIFIPYESAPVHGNLHRDPRGLLEGLLDVRPVGPIQYRRARPLVLAVVLLHLGHVVGSLVLPELQP